MSQSPRRAGPSEAMDRYAKAWAATNVLTRRGHTFSGHERHCCFLNTATDRFADISASAGFDLPEDGRSLALVDWDHDGDLDVWLTDRTAPRIRFFRNDYPHTHHFVTLRLQGTSSNRDAIGARIELHLDPSAPPPRKRIKTLRAGDGFLGQSSNVVHFGLGKQDRIDRLVVRWPFGKAEEFRNLQVDTHYRIIQGSGQAETWRPPRGHIALTPSSIEVPSSSERTRIVLVGRVPLPDAPYQDQAGNPVSLRDDTGAPTLVNLWASWCVPCLEELQAWSRNEQKLRRAQLNVVALSVDPLGDSANDADWRSILQRLRFPFRSGAATRELVTALDVVQQTILDRKRPLPVPCSFLVDRHGQIAVIYKGPVGVENLWDDLTLLDAEPLRRREAAVPLTGRWFSPPAASDPVRIAAALLDHGLIDVADRYTQQLLNYFTDGAGRRYVSTSSRKQKLADVHAFRGVILLGQDRLGEAADSFRHAIRLAPRNRQAHRNLGETLTKLGRLEEAVPHFLTTLEIDSEDADTHYNLAVALTQLGRHQQAVQHYHGVLRLRPDWPPAANNLAWILATHPDPNIRNGIEAVQLAKAVCQKVSYRDPTGLDTLAAAQAESGDFDTAIRTCQRAIELAQSQRKPQLAERMNGRLRLYQSHEPFRDVPPTNSSSSP